MFMMMMMMNFENIKQQQWLKQLNMIFWVWSLDSRSVIWNEVSVVKKMLLHEGYSVSVISKYNKRL